MMFEDIQGSIEALVEYLNYDSKRYYKSTTVHFHIFRNAVESGGYEKYLQAVYASTKRAYLNNLPVSMEFPIATNAEGRRYSDIAYIKGGYYCVEELKCCSHTAGFKNFLEAYKKDIMKVAGLMDYNQVAFGEGYVVGFMLFDSLEVIRQCKEIMLSDVDFILADTDLAENVCCTTIYEVDGFYMCAVITRAYSRESYYR